MQMKFPHAPSGKLSLWVRLNGSGLAAILMPTICPGENQSKQPVIRGVRYFLAHTPGLVRHGSKPSRDLVADPGLLNALTSHLRSYEEATGISTQPSFSWVHISRFPLQSRQTLVPTKRGSKPVGAPRRDHARGRVLRRSKNLRRVRPGVGLEEGFTKSVADALGSHPMVSREDLQVLGAGPPAIVHRVTDC